jgi:hypothetical protein
MSTPYSEVYDRFLSKINSYFYSTLTLSELEDELYDYLVVAIENFDECDKLVDNNDFLKQFNQTLNIREKDILATLMAIEYLTPKILTDELIIHALTDKDIRMTSQANHLDALQRTKSILVREANQKINKYKLDKGLDGFNDK